MDSPVNYAPSPVVPCYARLTGEETEAERGCLTCPTSATSCSRAGAGTGAANAAPRRRGTAEGAHVELSSGLVPDPATRALFCPCARHSAGGGAVAASTLQTEAARGGRTCLP